MNLIRTAEPVRLEGSTSEPSNLPPQIDVAMKVVDRLGGMKQSVSKTIMSGLNEEYSHNSVEGRDMTDEEERVYNTCLARVQSYVMSRLDKSVGSNKNDDVEVDYSFV